MKRQTALILGLVLSFQAAAAQAEQIEGTVFAAKDRTATIVSESEFLPAVGDKVEIFLVIPGLDSRALIGRGKVILLKDNYVIANITEGDGELAKGQVAVITSPKPTMRTPGTTPTTPPTTPMPTPSAPPATAAGTTPVKTALTGPSATQQQIIAAVAKMLPENHMSRHPLDNEISRRAFELFIESLDYNRQYFYESDVAEFRRFEEELDNEAKRGEMTHAYAIANRLMERTHQFLTMSEQLVDAEHDFNIEEFHDTSRTTALRPASEADARELSRLWVKHNLLGHMAAGADLEEARKRCRKYIERQRASWESWNDDDLTASFAGALAGAYDPLSKYHSPAEVEDVQIQNRMQLAGIGASLQEDDGYIKIVDVIRGGPAANDGRLHSGDRIVGVGEGDAEITDIVGFRLRDAVKLMRGTAGTKVRLRVLPTGEFETTVIDLTRAAVVLTSSRLQSTMIAGAQLPDGRSAKVGYIYLPSFYGQITITKADTNDPEYRSCSQDLQAAIDKLKADGADVLLVDMRSNSGGSITEMNNCASLFVGAAPLVQGKGHDGAIQTYKIDGAKAAWDGPLVVLASRLTAMGGYFFGSLLDHGRALLIADGKVGSGGTVQRLSSIGETVYGDDNPPNLGLLRCTNEQYYRLDGSTDYVTGFTPDVQLLSLDAPALPDDAATRPAMSTERIVPSAEFTPPAKLVKRFADDLNEASQLRREKSEFFKELVKRIEERQSQPTNLISLNKQKFLARQQTGNISDSAPALPEIAAVKYDDYLKEVLAIALNLVSVQKQEHAAEIYNDRKYEAAVAEYRVAVAAAPQSADASYRLAWVLATCPQASIRNGKQAVDLAKTACELTGRERWVFLLGLAVAHAEAKEFDAAMRELEAALEKAPEAKRQQYNYLEQRFANKQAFSQ